LIKVSRLIVLISVKVWFSCARLNDVKDYYYSTEMPRYLGFKLYELIYHQFMM